MEKVSFFFPKRKEKKEEKKPWEQDCVRQHVQLDPRRLRSEHSEVSKR